LIDKTTGVDMASRSYLNSCAWAQMLPPKYVKDTITQYWVMAHFSCIHYVPVWHWPIFPKIGSRDTEVVMNVYAYLESYRRFCFWNIQS